MYSTRGSAGGWASARVLRFRMGVPSAYARDDCGCDDRGGAEGPGGAVDCLQERIHHADAAEFLSVLEVFAVEGVATCLHCCSEDQGVVPRQVMAALPNE